MLKIVQKSKIWFSISFLLIIVGIGFMVFKGLNFGIDFRGGTQVVVQMNQDFNKATADKIVHQYAPDAITNTVNSTQLEIKSNKLDTAKVKEMVSGLTTDFKLKDNALVSENQIGASVGKQLTRDSIIALVVAILAVLVYVIFRFETNYGIAAIAALLHDILMTVSVYAILQLPVNTPFIAAILTIVGYSLNDTIVIFDRIRGNVKKMRSSSSEDIANKSVTQTMTRSINTTLTTLVSIVAVYFFVPTVRDFALPLIIGIASGAYSSIFIASPIWCMLKNRKQSTGKKEKKTI
ncbi:protein translocase subunit SecF [uncultured Clostridium sp.]|uniref:protein translocase subunit SecF n=1 Tax=uncultured Clostridium sp. TaxID=59620 RepID=UPI002609EC81|nr:protein translocase subunit SecF [uncultured Clostridium sp.]